MLALIVTMAVYGKYLPVFNEQNIILSPTVGYSEQSSIIFVANDEITKQNLSTFWIIRKQKKRVKTKQIRHSQSFGCFCFSLTLLSFKLLVV